MGRALTFVLQILDLNHGSLLNANCMPFRKLLDFILSSIWRLFCKLKFYTFVCFTISTIIRNLMRTPGLVLESSHQYLNQFYV